MDITDIFPESLNDYGAIIFWIILLILIIAIVAFYLYAKRMKKKINTIQKDLNAQQDIVKKSKEKRIQDLSDVKNKVNKLIEDENK